MCPKLIAPNGESVFASTAAAAVLLERGYTAYASTRAAGESQPKSIDAMSGKELDAHAATLGIDGWNTKLSIAKKREALHAAAGQTDDLDGLSDDQLRAHAAEANLEFADDADRDTLIALIRAAGESQE